MPSEKLTLFDTKTPGSPRLTPESNTLSTLGRGPLPLIEDDDDLVPLLRLASNEELAPLVEFIVKNGRWTEDLTATSAYKQHSQTGNHKVYADDIAAEIQRFGANSLATHLFRHGQGKRYRSILKSAARHCGVRRRFWESVATTELRITAKILGDAYERMSQEERLELLRTLQITKVPGLGAPLSSTGVQLAVQQSGFAAYKASVIIANSVASLSFAANAALTKAISLFVGPIGVAFDVLLGSLVAAGPAYRVVLRCICQICAIRQGYLRKRQEQRRRMQLIAGVLVALLLVIAAVFYMVIR